MQKLLKTKFKHKMNEDILFIHVICELKLKNYELSNTFNMYKYKKKNY